MPASTPIASSKSAALSRVLDLVPKGYAFHTSGEVPVGKLHALAKKFHERYGIGCTPAQRLTRKKHGQANAALVVHLPAGMASVPASGAPAETPSLSESPSAPGRMAYTERASWLLFATQGDGPVWREEQLKAVTDTPRLVWLGYELVRHPVRGQTSWTWRRTKAEMAELYALLEDQLKRRQYAAVSDTLNRIARQPGFAGVREQSWALCELARQRGYPGTLPHLYYLQKLPHGQRLIL